MTEEMGPITEPDSAFERTLAQIGGVQVSAVVWLYDKMLAVQGSDSSLEYDPRKLRHTIHGESENPGDEYPRSMLLSMAVFGGIILDTAILNSIPTVESTLLALLMLPVVTAVGVAGVASIYTLLNSTVLDLTTAKPDDGLDELAEQYLDGEMDEREFEQRADEVVARE